MYDVVKQSLINVLSIKEVYGTKLTDIMKLLCAGLRLVLKLPAPKRQRSTKIQNETFRQWRAALR